MNYRYICDKFNIKTMKENITNIEYNGLQFKPSPYQEKIFDNGNLVYTSPSLKEISENAKKELDTLWNEIKRIKNPHKYYVDLSQELWNLKDSMLHNL